MWRAYDNNGSLTYSFSTVMAMAPYYVVRTLGGAMFLTGAIICIVNSIATMRSAPIVARSGDRPLSLQLSE